MPKASSYVLTGPTWIDTPHNTITMTPRFEQLTYSLQRTGVCAVDSEGFRQASKEVLAGPESPPMASGEF